MDCSPRGSSVHGILQARILEWIAISPSRGSSQPRDRTGISCTAGRFFTDWATREAVICVDCGSNVNLVYKASASLVSAPEDRTVPHSLLSAAWGVPLTEFCSQVPPGSGASFLLQGGKVRVPPSSVSKGQPPSQSRVTRAQRFYWEGCLLLSGGRGGEGEQLTQYLLGWKMDTTFPWCLKSQEQKGQKRIINWITLFWCFI